jgi:hypothetical protein
MLDNVMLQKIQMIRDILDSSGKVILVGHSRTGKSFATQLIKKSLEIIINIIKENWSLVNKTLNLSELEKVFLENENIEIIEEKRVYVGLQDERKHFKGNQIFGKLRREWESFKEQKMAKSIFRWLIVDGVMNIYEERFLEEIENVKPQFDFMKLSQSNHCVSSKDRILNPGIQVILETNDVSHLSPRICFEYPIVHFPPNKSQVISLLTHKLNFPNDDWIYDEILEFFNFILIPFFKNMKSQIVDAKSKKVFRIKKYNTRSRMKRNFKWKNNESVFSDKSSRDIFLDLKINEIFLESFEGTMIWGIVVNMINIFQGFLGILKEKIKKIKEHKDCNLNQSDCNDNKKPEDTCFIVYRNVIKILCVFSLISALIIRPEKMSKIEKILKKLCKKHFSEFEKREKEKLKIQRKKDQFLQNYFYRERVNFPESNFTKVFPKIFVTSESKIRLKYEVFDQHEADNTSLIPKELSGIGNKLKLESKISLMHSNSFFQTISRNSKISLRNESIKKVNYCLDLAQFNKKEFFLQNMYTWRLTEYLKIIDKSPFMGVFQGGRRSGKGEVLRRFLYQKGRFHEIIYNSCLGGKWFTDYLNKICKRNSNLKMNILIENVWMVKKFIIKNLDEDVQDLQDKETDHALESKGNKMRLWGLSHLEYSKSKIERIYGKCSIVKADELGDKELKKIFELYFVGILANNSILINLKEKIIKGVSVILDCLEESSEKPSITRVMNLIKRVASSLKKVLFQYDKEKNGSQNSFFEQESIVRILVWELCQELFCEFDKNLMGINHYYDLDYWKKRSDLVNKRLKLSFRKKMSINLDLISGRISSKENNVKSLDEGLETVRVLNLKHNTLIKNGMQILKGFLQDNGGHQMKWIDLRNDFCLRRLVEINHRIQFSKILIFKGKKEVAKEYLQIVRMMTDNRELQVYDAEQIFYNENSQVNLLDGSLFEETYSKKRLKDEFELLKYTDEKQESHELSKNSFYSSKSEESFSRTSSDLMSNKNKDYSIISEFMMRMAQEVLLNDKRVVILLDSHFVDQEVQKLIAMVLQQGDQLFQNEKKKELAMSIFKQIKQKISSQNSQREISIMELNQEIQVKLSKKMCFVIYDGEGKRGLSLKKIVLSHLNKREKLKMKKVYLSEMFKNSHSHPHKIDTQNINQLIKTMNSQLNVFWDIPMNDKFFIASLQQKLKTSEHYVEDIFEFEIISKKFKQIFSYFHDLTQTDFIVVFERLITIFNQKNKTLTDKIKNMTKILKMQQNLEILKDVLNKKIETLNSKEEVDVDTLNHDTNVKSDMDDNPRILIPLIEQGIYLMKDCIPDLSKKIEKLTKRNTQANLLCESFIYVIVGTFTSIFRVNENLLDIIIQDLTGKDMLLETDFHEIVDYPLKEIDNEFRNILSFVQLKLLGTSENSIILLTGEDPIQNLIIQMSESNQKIVESNESDSLLEEKLSNILRFGQVLLLTLETSSIPNILKPFIYNEFIEHTDQLSIQIGNKLVGCSEKSRVFLSLPHKDILKEDCFKKDIQENIPIIDFNPMNQKELYVDLYLTCSFLKNPELKETRKKNIKKFINLYKKIYSKKKKIIFFLLNFENLKQNIHSQNMIFFKNLNQIFKDLKELQRQKKALIKCVPTTPFKISFFKKASYLFHKLSRFNTFSNRSWVSFTRFKNFVRSIYIFKEKNLVKKKSKLSSKKELTEKERKLLSYFLCTVKSVNQDQYEFKLILEVLNHFEILQFDSNKLMMPLLEKINRSTNQEEKLKWALNELSQFHGDFASFSDYIAINANLYNRLSSDEADIFIDRLFSNFMSSFVRSSNSNTPSIISDSISNSVVSQNHEIFKNLDSIKLFLLKHFCIDKFLTQIYIYIEKIIESLKIPKSLQICSRSPELSHCHKLMKLSLDLYQSPVIFIYGDKSSSIVLDICLLFSRAKNTKLESCRVFGPEPFLSKSLYELQEKTFSRKSMENLDKNIQKFAENIIHQSILESRPLLLNLGDGSHERCVSFLTWFNSENFRPTVPIFISVESPCMVPLPLRMKYLQFIIPSPVTLKTMLLSIFSSHIFVKNSYYNLFDKSSNNILKIVSFYSIFIYCIIFLGKQMRSYVADDTLHRLNFQEIFLLLKDLKYICKTTFYQSLVVQRLKDCKLIRECDQTTFERTCQFVFNVSYNSFVDRIKFKESNLGKDDLMFHNELDILNNSSKILNKSINNLTKENYSKHQSELWAGIMDFSYRFTLFENLDELKELILNLNEDFKLLKNFINFEEEIQQKFINKVLLKL